MNESKNSNLQIANALLGVQFLSDFGNQITSALLAACLLDITHSTRKVGLVYIMTTVGYVLFTLVGGILGDRLSRKHLLFFADSCRGLVVISMIAALWAKSIALIYATSFLLSFLGSIHQPVKSSTWAESIPSNRLQRYNSLSELSVQVSVVIGPLIASFLIVRQWVNFGFIIDAMTFFICAIIFAKIASSKMQDTAEAPKESRDLLRGFKIIAKQKDIAKNVAYDAIQMIGFGAFNATFFVLAQRDFGWSKAQYSYHLSIVSIFTVFCALLGSTKYIVNLNSTVKLTACALLSAITMWITLQVQSFALGSILVGVCYGLSVLTISVTKTQAQLIAKNFYPDHLASILASRFVIIKASTLLGSSVCLLMDDYIGLETTLSLLLIPIALSFIPIVAGRRRTAVAASIA